MNWFIWLLTLLSGQNWLSWFNVWLKRNCFSHSFWHFVLNWITNDKSSHYRWLTVIISDTGDCLMFQIKRLYVSLIIEFLIWITKSFSEAFWMKQWTRLFTTKVQAFLHFHGFDFRGFRFTAVYNSLPISSHLVLLSNLNLRSFCFRSFSFGSPY